jgi:hypothetical protein
MKSSIYPNSSSQHSSYNIDVKMEVHERLTTLPLFYKLLDECNFVGGGATYLSNFGEASTPSLNFGTLRAKSS